MAADRALWRVVPPMTGLMAWVIQFTVIYGVTAFACARGYADLRLLGFGLVPAVIVAATLVALAVTAVVLTGALARRPRLVAETAHANDRFLNYTTILISGLSLVAIAWTGLPSLILPACA